MSARKYGGGDKNFASHGLRRNTPSRNQDFNLTLRPNSHGGSRDRLNATMCPSIAPAVTPAVDWQTQCAVAYSSYLQSLFATEILKKSICKHETYLNDQLSIQSDALLKLISKKNDLEQEIETYELKPRLEELCNTLSTMLSSTLDILNPKVEEKVDALIDLLEEACNKLYLKKVKPFESWEEYDRFEELLRRCSEVLNKFINMSGDTESLGELACCLKRYEKLYKEVTTIEDSVVALRDEVGNLTLKTVSDMFANYRGYN